MKKIWDDWLPGVLNEKQMKELISNHLINDVPDISAAVGESAIDLSISDFRPLRMLKGSVKPSEETRV